MNCKTLYYTITLDQEDGILTGEKTIYVWEIKDNKPELAFHLYLNLEDNTEECISNCKKLEILYPGEGLAFTQL